MIRIYGASDDLVEVDGSFSEEYPCNNEIILQLVHEDSSMGVFCKYTTEGIWVIAPMILRNGGFLPWGTYIGTGDPQERYPGDYTMVLTVEAPDDVQVIGDNGMEDE